MKLTLESLHMYCQDCGDCLLWDKGVNGSGYPQANIGGKPGQMVRRYIFTELLGRELRRGERVSVRCSEKLCVAPNHLIARTYSKAMKMSYAAGRRMASHEYIKRVDRFVREGRTSLTWELVREIRSKEWHSGAEIASAYGISSKAANDVWRGRSWRESTPVSSVFSWRPKDIA